MIPPEQEVLVAPRRFFAEHRWFVPWKSFEPLIPDLSELTTWEKRSSAEKSGQLVQLVPVAVVRDCNGKYCATRRVRTTRRDLRGRIALTFGGHVERQGLPMDLADLLMETLVRELDEELGIRETNQIREVGLLIDSSSILASRHVGFLYEAMVSDDVRLLALDEFSKRSKFDGLFLTSEKLALLSSYLDPWSRLVVDEYINPPSKPKARQLGLLIDA